MYLVPYKFTKFVSQSQRLKLKETFLNDYVTFPVMTVT